MLGLSYNYDRFYRFPYFVATQSFTMFTECTKDSENGRL